MVSRGPAARSASRPPAFAGGRSAAAALPRRLPRPRDARSQRHVQPPSLGLARPSLVARRESSAHPAMGRYLASQSTLPAAEHAHGRSTPSPTLAPRPRLLPLLFLALLAALPVARCRVADPSPAFDDAFDEDDEPQQLGAEDAERLKERILEGLGLARIPDVRKMNVSQEEYARMHRLYVASVQEARSRQEAELSRAGEWTGPRSSIRFYSFPHRGRASSVGRRASTTLRLVFPVPTPTSTPDADAGPSATRVEHASLRLLASGLRPDESETSLDVSVYRTWAGGRRQLVGRGALHPAPLAPKWEELDATLAVAACVREGSRALALEVECPRCAVRGVVLGADAALNVLAEEERRPRREGVRRPRRAADPSQPSSRPSSARSRSPGAAAGSYARDMYSNGRSSKCQQSGSRCCRRDMEVVFSEIGFKWVKQPKSFDAGYCRGRCPPRFNPAHPHAIMQALTSKVRGSKSVPRPCCAPSKLAPLQILHPDPDDATRLVLSVWENTTVLECACS